MSVLCQFSHHNTHEHFPFSFSPTTKMRTTVRNSEAEQRLEKRGQNFLPHAHWHGFAFGFGPCQGSLQQAANQELFKAVTVWLRGKACAELWEASFEPS